MTASTTATTKATAATTAIAAPTVANSAIAQIGRYSAGAGTFCNDRRELRVTSSLGFRLDRLRYLFARMSRAPSSAAHSTTARSLSKTRWSPLAEDEPRARLAAPACPPATFAAFATPSQIRVLERRRHTLCRVEIHEGARSRDATSKRVIGSRHACAYSAVCGLPKSEAGRISGVFFMFIYSSARLRDADRIDAHHLRRARL